MLSGLAGTDGMTGRNSGSDNLPTEFFLFQGGTVRAPQDTCSFLLISKSIDIHTFAFIHLDASYMI